MRGRCYTRRTTPTPSSSCPNTGNALRSMSNPSAPRQKASCVPTWVGCVLSLKHCPAGLGRASSLAPPPSGIKAVTYQGRGGPSNRWKTRTGPRRRSFIHCVLARGIRTSRAVAVEEHRCQVTRPVAPQHSQTPGKEIASHSRVLQSRSYSITRMTRSDSYVWPNMSVVFTVITCVPTGRSAGKAACHM